MSQHFRHLIWYRRLSLNYDEISFDSNSGQSSSQKTTLFTSILVSSLKILNQVDGGRRQHGRAVCQDGTPAGRFVKLHFAS